MNFPRPGLKILVVSVAAGSLGILAGVFQPHTNAYASGPAHTSSYEPQRTCVDGILHYKWIQGRNSILQAVTVAVTPDGKPRTCNGQ